MSMLNRLATNLVKIPINNAYSLISLRSISVTSALNLKEIKKTVNGDNIVLEGVQVKSPREDLMVKPVHNPSTSCYMCALGLDVKHTDVLILSQFVRSDGCMLPRRITGLCKKQQRSIGIMVTMAQKAGLMINLTPSYCQKDPTRRPKWKKFNTYFDEKTIFMRKLPNRYDMFNMSVNNKKSSVAH